MSRNMLQRRTQCLPPAVASVRRHALPTPAAKVVQTQHNILTGLGARLATMSGEALFAKTANVQNAVALINALPANKLPKLLQRIVAKLHIPEEKPFSEEEEAQLQEVFEVERSDLTLILETISFFLETAAYHALSAKKFEAHLRPLELGDDQVTILCKLWHAKGKDVIANLRDRPFFPRKLVDVNWRLHLELASSAEAKPKLPNALFELAVSSKDKARTEADADRVQMEFTHAELYDFYNKLEMIQKQLDQLG